MKPQRCSLESSLPLSIWFRKPSINFILVTSSETIFHIRYAKMQYWIVLFQEEAYFSTAFKFSGIHKCKELQSSGTCLKQNKTKQPNKKAENNTCAT